MGDKTVGVIGNGAWGKALFHTIRQNTDYVTIYNRKETCTDTVIVLSVPTQAIRSLKPYLPQVTQNTIFINTTKGIEQDTHKLPGEIVKELWPDSQYYTLIGPGFAGEVIRDMPTLVNLGYDLKEDLLPEIVSLLQTPTFRIRSAKGIMCLELSAALKNVYAIGCGLADGMGFETNTRIQLITLAIEEAQDLFQKVDLKIPPESIAGTIGDLVLTCNSSESRNFRFGRYLAEYSVKESLALVQATVEGYNTLASLDYLEEKYQKKLTLAGFIKTIVTEDNPATVKKRFEDFVKQT